MANLKFQIDDALVEVTATKITAEKLIEKPYIITRDDNGNPILRKRIALVQIGTETSVRGKERPKLQRMLGPEGQQFYDKSSWIVTANGQELKKPTLHYWLQTKEGEQEVSKYTRTECLKPTVFIKDLSLSKYLIKDVYEIWSADENVQRILWKKAEEWMKTGTFGIMQGFTWGNGFEDYYAIVFPRIDKESGKFSWVMLMTQAQIEYINAMKIPNSVVTELPIEVTVNKKAPTINKIKPQQTIF